MLRFTLYTKTKGNLRTLVGKYFTGFTLIDGKGVYGRIEERSTQIVILQDIEWPAHRMDGYIKVVKLVHELAEEIKDTNQQECVLVTQEEVKGYLA